MIEAVLEAIGLKDEECKVYMALLSSGSITAGNLAKSLGMARPSVYGYLEKLCSCGVARQGLQRGVKIFTPEPPEKLSLLFKRQIADLQAKQKMLDVLIPELSKRAGLGMLRPRIQIFEGNEGAEAALDDILTYRDIHTYTLWPIRSSFSAASEEYFRYHNTERIRRRIYISGIWPRRQAVELRRYPFMGSGPEFFRELRLAPPEIDLTLGYWIYGNKTLFMSSEAESFGFIIESAELVQTLKTQHDLLWKLSIPLPVDPKDVSVFLRELKEE